MKISVIVPTFRRPHDLARCLASLTTQDRPADEILVVTRDVDVDSREVADRVAATSRVTRRVTVTRPGVIEAMSRGLDAATGDVIALIDDDAAADPTWLQRIDAHFAEDPTLGGVGGRDYVYHGDELVDGASPDVGRVQWWGRVIGNHSTGIGPPRTVDVLKGVNCAYRASALRAIGFDTRLRGTGAQVYWELSLGLAMQRAGYRLLYDPAIRVNHYEAVRHGDDQRVALNFHDEAQRDAVHNQTLVLLEHLPWLRRAAFVLWTAAIGTAIAPGVLHLPRLLMQRRPATWRRFVATVRGRAAGIASYVRRPARRPTVGQ